VRRALSVAAALGLAGCAVSPPAATPVAPVAAGASPAGYQYLYGSGEGGAMAMSAFHALIAYVRDAAAKRPTDSVVLASGSPMIDARFVPCGAKPLAVVFDIDETLLLNLGFEARAAAGEPYDQARWDRWERTGGGAVAASPGAVHATEDLRKLGVTVIFNSNRTAATADATAAALKAAGLGDAVHGTTLFLRGDDAGGSAKDGRRATIAARYCVIAMAGDQLGDFSDLFNAPMPVATRRRLAVHSSAGGLWGKGWFMLPNPVYGTALKGGVDDLFPKDKRWPDAAEEKK